MTHQNPLADPPEVCAASAADPAWRAAQIAKNQAAAVAFEHWRNANGMPLIQKGLGDRF